MPGLPIYHHLPKFAQIHVNCIDDFVYMMVIVESWVCHTAKGRFESSVFKRLNEYEAANEMDKADQKVEKKKRGTRVNGTK